MYGPGGNTGSRSCPFSFVVMVVAPTIDAGEVTRTSAPRKGRALFILDRSEEGPCQGLRGSHPRQQDTYAGDGQ